MRQLTCQEVDQIAGGRGTPWMELTDYQVFQWGVSAYSALTALNLASGYTQGLVNGVAKEVSMTAQASGMAAGALAAGVTFALSFAVTSLYETYALDLIKR
ncbi:MAG: hypothetical protein ACHQJ6_03645 [Candidatus Berkiellales bacterium]